MRSIKTVREADAPKHEFLVKAVDGIDTRFLVTDALVVKDGQLAASIFECGPAVLDFGIEFDEISYVLEGEIEIEDMENAKRYFVTKGSFYFLSKGCKTRFHIRKPTRLVFFHTPYWRSSDLKPPIKYRMKRAE
jgi:uncharacterized cupin superfamily protein